MVATPKYVERLLPKNKSAQALFAVNKPYFIFVIRSFRFLCDEHGFKVKELIHQRRETMISFVKKLSMQTDEGKRKMVLKLTVETENYDSISTFACYRSECHSLSRFVGMDEIASVYIPKNHSFYTEEIKSHKQQLARLRLIADTARENWPDVYKYLTRDIEP